MIDKKHIGLELPAVNWPVERGRVMAFARAIGDTRPECLDDSAARDAGYRGLVAPPTFWFGAWADGGTLELMLSKLDVPIARILHGEQSFTYGAPVCAGDVLTIKTRITDIVDKKGGKMEFVTQRSTITNQLGDTVGEMTAVIVARS
ncbi:MaoC family dehydratase N-terminal domain-containing protein [Ramlibacter solisilvae]|uniref:Acyl dehydratase n=1 Tax=Ramlibacter tataouinensis TaxID=94132 RepID=A0A127JX12_9BURK|nr:MaoC family dehydratase N-terminal domain-containing protein [Ramlibacter tataouinensis]AMO24413.1 acyl dehydratase [Ramlibacter tataouinensis]